jgi:hypothetical protein
VQRACGGAGDAPGAREGTQGNANDDETDESDGDVEIERGAHTNVTVTVREEAIELKRAEARAQLMCAIRSGCTGRGLDFGSAKEQVVAKIFDLYEMLDCDPMTLLSMDGNKMCVLARYKGDNKRVLQPQGPLLPGGLFTIMISQRWRTKARVKNDPALRHAYNALHMSNRTKHLAARGVTKIQQIRMFPHGASMAIFSQDSRPRVKSAILGAGGYIYHIR